jgi:hypothetical protein
VDALTNIVTATDTDYRAIIAFVWSFLTFALGFYMIYIQGNSLELDNILALLSPFLTLDAIFINSYFKSKEG